MVMRWMRLCAALAPCLCGCVIVAGIEQNSYLVDGGESSAMGAGGGASSKGGSGGSGGAKPQGDAAAPIGQGPWCNNGLCDWSEDKDTCPIDCPEYTCGNHCCEAGEDVAKCPADCGEPANCGNTVCETSLGETGYNCEEDCAAGDGGGE